MAVATGLSSGVSQTNRRPPPPQVFAPPPYRAPPPGPPTLPSPRSTRPPPQQTGGGGPSSFSMASKFNISEPNVRAPGPGSPAAATSGAGGPPPPPSRHNTINSYQNDSVVHHQVGALCQAQLLKVMFFSEILGSFSS